MTPERRARALYAEASERQWKFAGMDEIERLIARHIRAAENAALRRACEAVIEAYPKHHALTGNRVRGPAEIVLGCQTRAPRRRTR